VGAVIGQGQVAGCCGGSNEPPGPAKCGEIGQLGSMNF
jgi:hypothetical protein